MDGVRFSDVFWVSLAVFAGFELALAVNYLFLKLLFHAIAPLRTSAKPAPRSADS